MSEGIYVPSFLKRIEFVSMQEQLIKNIIFARIFSYYFLNRKETGNVVFFRNWTTYQDGFGDLDGNMWLGLDYIARLTAEEPVELHVYLEAFDGRWAYASYTDFQISNSSDNYRLHLSGYSGSVHYDGFSYHHGKTFSTYDKDNDLSRGNCAQYQGGGGGWWYGVCYNVNLNGEYRQENGHSYHVIAWYGFPSYSRISLKKTAMKVRPHN